MRSPKIIIRGCKQNNLKNINLVLPLKKIITICGPSGSGKSSLAFETLYAEGQRQYIECLPNYTKQFLHKMEKPWVESIEGIPPALALEQKNSIKSPKSTVGSLTEINEFLRSLFECIGTPICEEHNEKMMSHSPDQAAKHLMKSASGKRIYITTKIPKASDKILKKALNLGFSRILKDKKTVNLQEYKVKKNETIYFVVDRLQVSDNQGRIAQSIRSAYGLHTKLQPKESVNTALVLSTEGESWTFSNKISCPKCDLAITLPFRQLLNPNSPTGACLNCNGFGKVLKISFTKIIPNTDIPLIDKGISFLRLPSFSKHKTAFKKFCDEYDINFYLSWNELKDKHKELVWKWIEELFQKLEKKKHRMFIRIFLSRNKENQLCPECKGSRLTKEASYIRINGKNLQDLATLSIKELHNFITNDLQLTKEEEELGKISLQNLRTRLSLNTEIGLGYITLDRLSRTLSGGEIQRINLVKQLSGGLSETLYVLDEPSIGLHPRDIDKMCNILKKIQKNGNTLVIVEHETKVLNESDFVVEIGPKSGAHGGQILFCGAFSEFQKQKDSPTLPFLKPASLAKKNYPKINMKTYKAKIQLNGCTGNNLQSINLEIPLRQMICVTGVSGSGKSSLIGQTLYPALAKKHDSSFSESCLPFKELTGADLISNVIYIDQHFSGVSEKTMPATYLKIFQHIRTLFSNTSDAERLGYTPGHFSINSNLGKCPDCNGYGYNLVEMVFMDDIKIKCETCKGRRLRKESLQVNFQGKNIAEVLDLSIADAIIFFQSFPKIRGPLNTLCKVGLDYIQLGQPLNTLSGGEAQRIKIASQLIKKNQRKTLFILDEPSKGLHPSEVLMLIKTLQDIVKIGGTVLLIEHNIDTIMACQHIIDIGPQAGPSGGQIVAKGTPLEIMKHPESLTGQALTKHFRVSP